MRRANNPEVVRDANGVIYAINLGADFCAEHEWGVKRLREIMGITEVEHPTGLKDHSATVPPGDKFLTFTGKKKLFIILEGSLAWYINDPKRIEEYKASLIKGGRELSLLTWKGDKNPPFLAAAWDEGSFGIIFGANGPAEVRLFGDKLADAIAKGDYSVWFGGNCGNPFARSGLVVAITSLVPRDVKDYMAEAYKDQKRLSKADKATGVKKLLEKKGKRYFACSPEFTPDGDIRYWLNPMEQDKHESGWYTPEELADWARGVVGNKVDKVTK